MKNVAITWILFKIWRVVQHKQLVPVLMSSSDEMVRREIGHIGDRLILRNRVTCHFV